MSPQPAAAPAQTAQTTPHAHAALMARIDEKDPGDLSSAEKQISRAVRLERERSEAMKKVAANREYLRLMEENEELGDEEADWLDDFYPQKERGRGRSEDEIERTRKAKAAARA